MKVENQFVMNKEDESNSNAKLTIELLTQFVIAIKA